MGFTHCSDLRARPRNHSPTYKLPGVEVNRSSFFQKTGLEMVTILSLKIILYLIQRTQKITQVVLTDFSSRIPSHPLPSTWATRHIKKRSLNHFPKTSQSTGMSMFPSHFTEDKLRPESPSWLKPHRESKADCVISRPQSSVLMSTQIASIHGRLGQKIWCYFKQKGRVLWEL